MKYYKITLRKEPGSTAIKYPVNYQAEIGNYAVDHLYYGENLLLVLPDNIKNVARTDVVEITKAEAKAISEANEKRGISVSDGERIRQIEIKLNYLKIKKELGLSLNKLELAGGLTADDIKAIDEKDETVPGFSKNKILADRIENFKNYC